MSKEITTAVVKANPYVYKVKSSGVKKARVDLLVGENINATYWSDDPTDEHIFSFKKGDEVEIELWQRGDFYNATILDAAGSEKNPNAAAEKSMEGQFGTGEYANLVEREVAYFGLIRQAVNINADLDTAISELSEPEQEEVRKQATASVYIQLQRMGVTLDEAFSSDN